MNTAPEFLLLIKRQTHLTQFHRKEVFNCSLRKKVAHTVRTSIMSVMLVRVNNTKKSVSNKN